MSTRSIFWFRRDLRLRDNPALLAAIAESDEVIPLFIIDLHIANRAGEFRRAYLAESLRALDASLGGKLHVIAGEPVNVLRELMKKYNATSVHVSADYAPYGVARDSQVESAGITLTRTGSGYAVSPGRVLKADGSAYRVFTPFFKAWSAHGWRGAVDAPGAINSPRPDSKYRPIPDWAIPVGAPLQSAGEEAAIKRWRLSRKRARRIRSKSRLRGHQWYESLEPAFAVGRNSSTHDISRAK